MKKKQSTDEQIISLYQQTQTRQDFNILYERYAHKVFQTCLKLTGDTEDARDATQDVFLKVFDKLNAFQHRSMFSTWLYSITYNHCIDAIKQGKRLKQEALSAEAYNQIDIPQEVSIDEQVQQVQRLLHLLPDDEVHLLTLRYECGLSIRELSQRFHLKECAVKMRLKRSRDKLRLLYQQSQ